MNFKLPMLAIFATLSLTACLEVEDDGSNKELVTAIEAQNEQLQNSVENINATPVNLSAKVFNITTGEYENDLIIKVKVGQTWLTEQQINNGEINLTDLPTTSNFSIIISSPNNSFISKAFFGVTPWSTRTTFTDLGMIEVAQGKEYSFSALNVDTNEHVSALKFYSYSHQQYNNAAAADREVYAHRSTFNAETKRYSITIPKGLSGYVYASLDLDKDGNDDYIPSWLPYNSNRLYISSNVIGQLTQVTLNEVVDENSTLNNLTINVSVLDQDLKQIPGLLLSIDDSINGYQSSTFNEETSQYEFSAKAITNDQLSIFVPAFTHNDINYKSSTIQIRDSGNRYRIYRTGENYYYINKDLEVLDIFVKPDNEATGSSDLSIIYKTDKLDTVDQSFKMFFSEGVSIDQESATITSLNSYTVTKGNDSVNDSVSPGSTSIDGSPILLESNNQLSLNDTLLTIKPVTTLLPGDYRYELSRVTVLSDNQDRILNYRESFSVDTTEEFNINDLILDNTNYTTNGSTVISSNTAGITISSTNNRNRSSLIFPDSIKTLKSFTLSQKTVVENGQSRSDENEWDIMLNGNPYNVYNRRFFIANAENESIISNSVSTIRGNANTYGYRYYLYSEYLYDDRAGLENSITYDYYYETKEGDKFTGTITLQVK